MAGACMLLWGELVDVHDSGAAAVSLIQHLLVVQSQSGSLRVKSASTPMVSWLLRDLM